MKGAAGLPREEGAEAAGIKVDRALLQEREEEGTLGRFSLGSHNDSEDGVPVASACPSRDWTRLGSWGRGEKAVDSGDKSEERWVGPREQRVLGGGVATSVPFSVMAGL